jgi:hypothetical protein
MQRLAVQVLEHVEVVSQLSMEPLACMAREFGVDVTRNFSPIDGVRLRDCCIEHRGRSIVRKGETLGHLLIRSPQCPPCDLCLAQSPWKPCVVGDIVSDCLLACSQHSPDIRRA